MSANKVILNGDVLIDLTEDTTVESNVRQGKTFHKADGTKAVGTSSGLDINGIVKQYKVNAGASVSAGDFVEFVTKAGGGQFLDKTLGSMSVCKIDETHVFVAYGDIANSNYGTAVILTVDEEAITLGEETVFNAGSTADIDSVALSDNRVLVAFSDYGNSKYGTAIVLTINGSVISSGTPYVFESSITRRVRTALWEENIVLLVYSGDSSNTAVTGDGMARVLSVSGTAISAGAPHTFHSAASAPDDVAALSSSKAVVLSRSAGLLSADVSVGTYGGGVCVLTRSGTSVTSTKLIPYSNYDVTRAACVALTDSKVLVVYMDDNTDDRYYFNAVVLTVNDLTISLSTPNVIYSRSVRIPFVSKLTANRALATCYDYGGNKLVATILTVNDTTALPTSPVDILLAGLYNSDYRQQTIVFSSNSVLVLQNDGRYVGLTINGDTITVNEGTSGGTFVQPATSNLFNVGVAKTSGAEGETVDVYCVE
jgi:hypothetical protein